MTRRETRTSADAGPPRMPPSDEPAPPADQTDAAALVERASKAVEARRFDEALADLAEALRLDPVHADAHLTRGIALDGKADHEAALIAFTEAIRLSPDAGSTYIWRAVALTRLGRNPEALADLDAAVRLSPDAASFRYRGEARYRFGDLDAALADLDEAVRLDADDGEAHLFRGFVFYDRKAFAAAAAAFAEAVRVKPRSATARVWRGTALSELGRIPEAIAEFDEAIRLRPDDGNAYLNRACAHERAGNHAAAVADHTEQIRLDPSNPKAYRRRALALSELGRRAEAVRDFGKAIRLRPDDASLYRQRGVERSWLDDYDGAISDYTRAIELNPDDARAVLFRAQALFHLREFDDAERDIAEALRLDPGYADAYLWRGRLRSYEEDTEAAIADFTEAIRLDPSEAEAFRRRGGTWTEAGEYGKAVADYTEAIRLDPKSASAHAGRAEALQWLGKNEQASLDYDTADRLRSQKSDQDDDMTDQQTLVYPLLRDHFDPTALESLSITERTFPARVRADLQRAIDAVVGTMQIRHFGGVRKRYAHEGVNLTDLCVRDRNDPPVSAPPQYEEMDIGEEKPLRCLKGGLWLLEQDGSRLAVYFGLRPNRCGDPGVRFQVATADDEAGRRLTENFFAHLEKSVREARSYRGKILSLEMADRYSGASTGIKVHRLRAVAREQVILPRKTLDLLERNVVGFVRNRPRLAELGLATKKGLLFYGPPGTGKTHTIHYLAGALEGTTTLLIAAEQVALLGEYMTLARLLAPSMVVIEDADLIARDRGSMNSPCEEALLNKLLNEMDGLREGADILFVLTTNRPEALEAALAGRPGRVDQAIEFPYPDEEGRTKLVRLYARGLKVPEEVVAETVRRTENVSAAFIKELMRRAAQFRFERGGDGPLVQADVDDALDELLFSGGSLNRRLLGGNFDGADEGSCVVAAGTAG